MATARMDEILRQRDPDLRAAVAAMLEDGPAEAVERLGDNVHEADADELGEAAARLWLSLHPEARARTAILAPTHALREDINEAVREGLRGEGVLHGRVLEIERLVSLGLTRAQKADIAGYRPGDVLVFHNDLYRVKADDACTVTGTDEEGRVLLHNPDGRPRRLDPSGPVRYRYELYETRPIRLQAGDRIRWTRNDGKRGLVNGGEAEVLAIGYRFVTLGDGRRAHPVIAPGRPAAAPCRPCLEFDPACGAGHDPGQCDPGAGLGPRPAGGPGGVLCRDQPGARPGRGADRHPAIPSERTRAFPHGRRNPPPVRKAPRP